MKPTFFVLPSGHILESSPLCYSDSCNNDATILKWFLETSGLVNYCEEGDVAIFDRGYRDAVQGTEDAGLEVYMPNLLQKTKTPQKQQVR